MKLVETRCTAILLIFVVAVTCGSRPTNGDDLSAQELASAMKASIGQISTIEARYRVYYERLPASGSGITGAPDGRDFDGQGMHSEFAWGYDSASDAEYVDGKVARPKTHADEVNGEWIAVRDEGMYYYKDLRTAYDGEILHAYTESSDSGKIMGGRGDMFAARKTPSLLWGRNFVVVPNRDITEVLDGAQLIHIENTPSHLKVLRNDIKVGVEDWHVTVWIDTKHGFMPRRMEAAKTFYNMVMSCVEVDEMHEVQPGIWVPIRGRTSGFAVIAPKPSDGVYPNGMTVEELRRLSREEARKLIPELGYKRKKIGLGTGTIVADVDTLKINHRIPDERFTIDFPVGTFVWNETIQEGYQVGRFDDPQRTLASSETSDPRSHLGYRTVLMWVSAILVLGTFSLFLWRRFLGKRPT